MKNLLLWLFIGVIAVLSFMWQRAAYNDCTQTFSFFTCARMIR